MLKKFWFVEFMIVFALGCYEFKAETTSLDAPIFVFETVDKEIIEVANEEPYLSEIEPLESISERQITDEEYALLARVCMSETGGKWGEPFEGKVAVLETILNRVDMGWGTIKEVVTAKYQYSMANNGEPDYTVYEAVDYVLNNERMHPSNMIYFRTKHYHTFGQPYMKIGNHYFSLEVE